MMSFLLVLSLLPMFKLIPLPPQCFLAPPPTLRLLMLAAEPDLEIEPGFDLRSILFLLLAVCANLTSLSYFFFLAGSATF